MAALKRGLAYCASLGITSIHNMDGNFYQLELLDALRQDGNLICRVQVPWHQKNYFAPERVDEAIEMRGATMATCSIRAGSRSSWTACSNR